MEKLTRQQWEELNAQYQHTPGCGEFVVSGEHYILMSVLNKLGHRPAGDCLSIIECAEELLANGYQG